MTAAVIIVPVSNGCEHHHASAGTVAIAVVAALALTALIFGAFSAFFRWWDSR